VPSQPQIDLIQRIRRPAQRFPSYSDTVSPRIAATRSS
jgi:hypothetical protein